jgi:hypothetical protein
LLVNQITSLVKDVQNMRVARIRHPIVCRWSHGKCPDGLHDHFMVQGRSTTRLFENITLIFLMSFAKYDKEDEWPGWISISERINFPRFHLAKTENMFYNAGGIFLLFVGMHFFHDRHKSNPGLFVERMWIDVKSKFSHDRNETIEDIIRLL